MMSAPSPIIRSACAMAAAGSAKRPPSANESGVRLRMPITIGRRSASSRSSGCGGAVADAVRGTMLTAGALRRPWGRVKQSRRAARRYIQGPSPPSIGYLQRQLPGLIDPAPHPPFRRQEPHQLGLLIGFAHRRGELGDIAVLQFLDRIDADRLEQFGVVFAHALDAHAIGKVRPAQDGLFVDTDFRGKLFAPFGALCGLEQLCSCPYAYLFQLLRRRS